MRPDVDLGIVEHNAFNGVGGRGTAVSLSCGWVMVLTPGGDVVGAAAQGVDASDLMLHCLLYQRTSAYRGVMPNERGN